MENVNSYDYIIIGAGVIGMTIAYELYNRNPKKSILIIEKERDVAKHSSGRNSGVLHAGFYYHADSLKAKFTVEGNKLMQDFCRQNNIYVNSCQKIVVAKNASELPGLNELYKRGKVNGVSVSLINKKEVHDIDPNVVTYQQALLSPTTACVDPKQVCFKLKEILQQKGVKFNFEHELVAVRDNTVICKQGVYIFNFLINAAGLYADKIAQQMGLAQDYMMLPFKGIYLKYLGDKDDVKTNIYPVPNLKNPFLGVHFTKTVQGDVKIGPTAIPAFWRENYKGFDNVNISELAQILYYQTKLFFLDSFNFRSLAVSEMKKYRKQIFINESKCLVNKIDDNFIVMPAGIRAQLLNKKTNKLEMDFILEKTPHSLHVLNAVSPAFTCSFSFAKHLVLEHCG